jgi:hypothetical protein
MAFLPLSLSPAAPQAGVMSSATSHQAGAIRRLTSRVGHAIAECNEATRRLATLAGTPERYQVDPDRAPDTYAEFLIRSAAAMRREPNRWQPPAPPFSRQQLG